MKVRARVKAREYLPEWAKCCEKAIRHNSSLVVRIVDLSTTRRQPSGSCMFCGHAPEIMPIVVKDVDDGMYVGIDLLDLDEGPGEAQ